MSEEFNPEFGIYQQMADKLPRNGEPQIAPPPENPLDEKPNVNPPFDPNKKQIDPKHVSKFDSFYFNGDFADIPAAIIDPAQNTNGIIIENAEFVSYEGLLSRDYPNAPGLFGSRLSVGDPALLYNKILKSDRIAVAVANSSAVVDRKADDVAEYNGAFTGVQTVAAVAGQFGQLQLFNPVGSGVIVSVDSVDFLAAGPFGVKVNAAALATPGAVAINKNLGSAAAAKGLLYYGTNAALQGTAAEAGYYLGNSLQEEEPYRLQEGQGLLVDVNTVNTAFTASIKWRELQKSSQTKNVQGRNNRDIYLPPGYGLYFAGNAVTSSVILINVHWKYLSA